MIFGGEAGCTDSVFGDRADYVVGGLILVSLHHLFSLVYGRLIHVDNNLEMVLMVPEKLGLRIAEYVLKDLPAGYGRSIASALRTALFLNGGNGCDLIDVQLGGLLRNFGTSGCFNAGVDRLVVDLEARLDLAVR